MSRYEVVILKEGYNRLEGTSKGFADCTITLLKGPKHILVDTGNPADKDYLINALAERSLSPDDIDYVVCTHGHLDHVGNLNLFTKATQILGKDVCVGGDEYTIHDFVEGRPYEIDEHVHVMFTPGHTDTDVSVVVQTDDLGKVVCTGDLFECEADLEDPSLWTSVSEHQQLQEQNRVKILSLADAIVPGHGPMFTVKPDLKRHISIEEMKDGDDGDMKDNDGSDS